MKNSIKINVSLSLDGPLGYAVIMFLVHKMSTEIMQLA
jgi:hypothetical protein